MFFKKISSITLAVLLSFNSLSAYSFPGPRTPAKRPDTSNYFGGNVNLQGGGNKLDTPLYHIFSAVDWGLFFREFEISMELGHCGSGLDFAIGFKAHMAEPIGFMETTKKPMHFPFADLDLGGSMIKSGTTRATIRSEGGRDEFVYAHFIYFPLFGIIFKKKLPIFCFAGGGIEIPFISEMFPPYQKDTMGKMLMGPEVAAYTPQGLLSSVLNCVATFSEDVSNGNKPVTEEEMEDVVQKVEAFKTTQDELESKGQEYLHFIRNSMYFANSCQGFLPIGGYVEGEDPISDAELNFAGVAAVLHGINSAMIKPFLMKQTNFSANTGKLGNTPIPDTMCSPKKYPLPIEAQYVPQLVYPTVGNSHENGTTPLNYTTAANVPGSKDSAVFMIWERRDYYAFAYECPN